jgi:hypothetical protein
MELSEDRGADAPVSNGDSDTDIYDFDQPDVESNAIDSSPDCGICYKTGFVPGFEHFGQSRYVFTSLDVTDLSSVTIDRRLVPHAFESLSPNSYVSFEVTVPKYFKTVRVSVRNNYDQLDDYALMLGTTPMQLSDFRNNAGKTITINVHARIFTHLVLVFDLGTDPVVASIAQLSKVTDWTKFETVGDLTVHIPNTVPELTVGSVFIVPSKHMGLRVTDVPQVRTSHGANLEWSCTARFMQPQEQIKSISAACMLR